MITSYGRHHILTHIGLKEWKKYQLPNWWFFSFHCGITKNHRPRWMFVRVCGWELSVNW